jgi:hypothetical protein
MKAYSELNSLYSPELAPREARAGPASRRRLEGAARGRPGRGYFTPLIAWRRYLSLKAFAKSFTGFPLGTLGSFAS